MAEQTYESKYAQKLLARRRHGGPEYRSLGNVKEDANEKFLPMPRPMHTDYFPEPRSPKGNYGLVREALNTLLPFEKADFISKFRRDHASR